MCFSSDKKRKGKNKYTARMAHGSNIIEWGRCVCVRARMRACVHVCMRACMCACMHACVHACVRACVCKKRVSQSPTRLSHKKSSME